MDTSGFWISPDGKSVPVREHFDEVKQRPATFGFTRAEAERWTRDDRETVLLYAVGRGWIRVRGHRTYTTIDVNELSPDAIWRIKEHLVREGAWENEKLNVVEHKHKKSWPVAAGWFLDDEALGYARNF